MLISALCDYYDDLARDGEVVPEGYIDEKISYIVVLKSDGSIDSIIDYRLKKDNTENKKVPRNVLMQLRERKPATNSEYIEHRFKYIFGLNYTDNKLTPYDPKHNARDSHEKFVNQTLEWIKGLDSPIVNAYRNFIQKWEPEKETNNELVLSIAKNKDNLNCIFAFEDNINHFLHQDSQVIARWDEIRKVREENTKTRKGQCAVTGKIDDIINLHTQLHIQSGVSLICYNNDPECSYGNKNAFNSNISVTVMKKYTYALDYLLHKEDHTQKLDDITVVFWATGGNEPDVLNRLFDNNNDINKNNTEKILRVVVEKARKGQLIKNTLESLKNIDENVTYYILGLMSVKGRLSVKFFYRRRLGELFQSIAYHQYDMQISDDFKMISLPNLKKELTRTNKEKVDATLIPAVIKSIILNSPYPIGFFSKMMIRIKNDRKINSIRAGALKAYFNRKSRLLKQKEEFQMSLDMSNTNPNYLCGRLFAVLEKIQEKSQGDKSESKTIRDSFFSAAASMPSTVFPNLIKKAQYHLNKLEPKYEAFYSKQLGEIIDMLDVEFPSYASTEDQGRFMLGYYQQREHFFNKKNKEDKNNGTQE